MLPNIQYNTIKHITTQLIKLFHLKSVLIYSYILLSTHPPQSYLTHLPPLSIFSPTESLQRCDGDAIAAIGDPPSSTHLYIISYPIIPYLTLSHSFPHILLLFLIMLFPQHIYLSHPTLPYPTSQSCHFSPTFLPP